MFPAARPAIRRAASRWARIRSRRFMAAMRIIAGSTSSAVTVTVQALVPSFTLGASPQSGTGCRRRNRADHHYRDASEWVQFASEFRMQRGVERGDVQFQSDDGDAKRERGQHDVEHCDHDSICSAGASQEPSFAARSARRSGAGLFVRRRLVVFTAQEERSLAVHPAGCGWNADVRGSPGGVRRLWIEFV